MTHSVWSNLVTHTACLLAEWRAKTFKNNSNNDGVFYYFIKMKDYIVKTRRSLRAEWNIRNTLYSLRKRFQVVYLFDCMKNSEVVDELPRSRHSKKRRYHTAKRKKFPLNGGCFRKWIMFVTCRSTYHYSLCYPIESRTSKNSDELRACIEKAHVVVTYSV